MTNIDKACIRGQYLWQSLLCITAMFCTSAADPQYYYRCWVVPRAGRVMTTSSPDTTRNIRLVFNPPIVAGQYVPGRSYQVSVLGDGGSDQMLGSNAGSWIGSTCTKDGTTGIYSQSGTWTAPASGSVIVGGTRGGPYAYGVDTIQVSLTAGMMRTTVAAPSAPPTVAPSERPTTVPTTPTTQSTSFASTSSQRNPASSVNTTSVPFASVTSTDTPSTSATTTIAPSSAVATTVAPNFSATTPIAPSIGPEISITGWLVDTRCLVSLNTIDGVNVTTDAPNHTIQCMLINVCINSGYTVLERVGSRYVATYQLDRVGIGLSVGELGLLADQGVINNVQFMVRGFPDPNTPTTYLGRPSQEVNGISLGMVLRTTSVTVSARGPTLPTPIRDNNHAVPATTPAPGATGFVSTREPDVKEVQSLDLLVDLDDSWSTDAIVCVAVVAVVSFVVLFIVEKTAAKSGNSGQTTFANPTRIAHENPAYDTPNFDPIGTDGHRYDVSSPSSEGTHQDPSYLEIMAHNDSKDTYV